MLFLNIFIMILYDVNLEKNPYVTLLLNLLYIGFDAIEWLSGAPLCV